MLSCKSTLFAQFNSLFIVIFGSSEFDSVDAKNAKYETSVFKQVQSNKTNLLHLLLNATLLEN